MENKFRFSYVSTPVVNNLDETHILHVNEAGVEPKITLKNVWLHFKKICTHKYWVAKYCFKAGLVWQGITHDLSKFSWTEFWESVKYYQGSRSPINAAKEDQGYSLAWQHHKGRNKHHYEYWTDKYDDGTVALEMPYKYAVELICDWYGAARAYTGNRGKDFYQKELAWWLDKRNNKHPKMNQQTMNFVDIVFHNLADKEKYGADPMKILSNELIMKYYFKLAKLGDYEAWVKVEEKMLENAEKEMKQKSGNGIKVNIVVAPIFF